MEAERPEPLAGLVHLAPQIVASEADMLPAQWRDMGKQFVQHHSSNCRQSLSYARTVLAALERARYERAASISAMS